VKLVETILFCQGDDADEMFAILYPDMDGASTGWTTNRSVRLTIEHMAQWDNGEPRECEQATDLGWRETGKGYTLRWDYGYGWISLERRCPASHSVKER
jgi:hypothetical protein